MSAPRWAVRLEDLSGEEKEVASFVVRADNRAEAIRRAKAKCRIWFTRARVVSAELMHQSTTPERS